MFILHTGLVIYNQFLQHQWMVSSGLVKIQGIIMINLLPPVCSHAICKILNGLSLYHIQPLAPLDTNANHYKLYVAKPGFTHSNQHFISTLIQNDSPTQHVGKCNTWSHTWQSRQTPSSPPNALASILPISMASFISQIFLLYSYIFVSF